MSAKIRPALLAINERLRDAFIADSQRGLDRWNRAIHERGIDYRLTLPHRGFNRQIGCLPMSRSPPPVICSPRTIGLRRHATGCRPQPITNLSSR